MVKYIKKKYNFTLIESEYFPEWLLLYKPVDRFLYLYQNLPSNHYQNHGVSNVMDISLSELAGDIAGEFVTADINLSKIIFEKINIKDRHNKVCQEIEEVQLSIKEINKKEYQIEEQIKKQIEPCSYSVFHDKIRENKEYINLEKKEEFLKNKIGLLLKRIVRLEKKRCKKD